MKEEKLITNLALIAFGYFGVVKPLTNLLGVTKGSEERQAEKIIETAKSTYLAPSYKTQVVKKYGAEIAAQGLYFVEPSNHFCNEQSSAFYWAKGVFNDDETAVSSTAKKFSSKLQISIFVNYFDTVYGGGDFLTYLNSYLTEQEIRTLCLDYWATLPTAYTNKIGASVFDTSNIKKFTKEV